MQWDAAPGTSHPAMMRLTNQASRELRTIPGVRSVSAHVGRAIMGDQPVGMNSSQLWVTLDPWANYHATVDAVQSTVGGFAGMTATVQTNTQQAMRRVLTGTTDDMVVRVFGPEIPCSARRPRKSDRRFHASTASLIRAWRPRSRSRRSRSAWTSTKPSSTGSSRATSAEQRPLW